MITILVISVSSLLIAAAANAVMDTLAHHYNTSIFARFNPNFWNPAQSWKNKYKNGDPARGARFPGSTTLFVAFTDAWHLFKAIMLNAYLVAAVLPMWVLFSGVTWHLIAAFVITKTLQGIIFNTLYHKAFILRTPPP